MATNRTSSGAKTLLPLLVLALAQLGTSADNGAFSVATAEIMRVFGCSMADVQLASTVYSLVAGTFMLASGLLGIVVGWIRVFRLGLVLAVVGELVCTLAPGIDLLIWGGRMVVGLGASLIIPSVLGMIPMIFEGDSRKQAYGVIAASAALATIVPILFGLLIDGLGFRFTFGVLAAYFVVLLLGSSVLPRAQGFGEARFDGPGAVVASVGLFAVMFGLSRLSVWGVVEPLASAPFAVLGISPALPIVGAGLVLLVALAPLESHMERRFGVAILPSSFRTNHTVRAGVVAIALPFFYMGAQGLVATSFYQLVIGLGATQTALLGIISGTPMLVLAMWVPRRFPHLDPWTVVRAGYLCLAAACAGYAVGVRGMSFGPVLVAATLLGGVGVGLVNSQANNIVASAVPERDSQQSGGVQGAARNLGLALGSAVMGSVLLVAVNTGMDARVADTAVLAEGQRASLKSVAYTYESDASFSARMEALGVTGEAGEELLAQNASVRADAATLAMGSVAALSVLALATTKPWAERA